MGSPSGSLPPVNSTLSPTSGLAGVNEKVADGGVFGGGPEGSGATVISTESSSDGGASVWGLLSVTVYWPSLANTCVTSAPVAVPPSPKSHESDSPLGFPGFTRSAWKATSSPATGPLGWYW